MMSRHLPAHANLDHLKKQSKDLLHDLQERNPGSQLADAQHAIAREYGFASWPKLKAHVESLARPADSAGALAVGSSYGGNVGGSGGMATNVIDDSPPNYSFERYTPKARQALFFSRYEASQVGSASIEPEHVLLGLIRAAQGLTNRIFERAQLSLEDARADVAAPIVAREKLPSSVEIPFGTETQQILRYTIEEADRLLHHDIGIAHLLLGILRDERSIATSILCEKGMRLHTVRDDIVQLLNEEPA
jgi:ClpA/ClpB-like protein